MILYYINQQIIFYLIKYSQCFTHPEIILILLILIIKASSIVLFIYYLLILIYI